MLHFGKVKTLLNQKFLNGQLQRPSKNLATMMPICHIYTSLQLTNNISLWDLYHHTPAITAFLVSVFTALWYSIVT
jgi:hypothetical protein